MKGIALALGLLIILNAIAGNEELREVVVHGEKPSLPCSSAPLPRDNMPSCELAMLADLVRIHGNKIMGRDLDKPDHGVSAHQSPKDKLMHLLARVLEMKKQKEPDIGNKLVQLHQYASNVGNGALVAAPQDNSGDESSDHDSAGLQRLLDNPTLFNQYADVLLETKQLYMQQKHERAMAKSEQRHEERLAEIAQEKAEKEQQAETARKRLETVIAVAGVAGTVIGGALTLVAQALSNS